jgi:heme exporter protein CcmB
MKTLQAAWQIAVKDFRVESRSRELVFTTLFFALTSVLVFAFSFVQVDGTVPVGAASGILWVTLAFAGTIALTRTFEREREHDTLRGLLLSPVPRTAVYLGKLFGVVLLLLAIQTLIVPLTGLFFQAPIARSAGWLILMLVTGALGFAAVGTLFAAMLVRARSRDVLLPLVLFPIVVPVIIAGVRGTNALFLPEPDFAMARLWLAMLISFDAVFVSLALWTCGPLLGES